MWTFGSDPARSPGAALWQGLAKRRALALVAAALSSAAIAGLWRLAAAAQRVLGARQGPCSQQRGGGAVEDKDCAEGNLVPAPDSTDDQHGILLFYQYAQVAEVATVVQQLKQVCEALQLSGRVRVSFEGFNGNLSGTWEACQAFMAAAVEKLPELAGTDFKLAPCRARQTFRGLKVWESKEVCGLFAGSGDARDEAARGLAEAEGGTHLKPEEWHETLKSGGDDLVLFDCRNLYETRIGRFTVPDDSVQWVDPYTRFFKDLPAYFDRDENLQQFQGKRVMMYCTGGVRCERASALLKQKLSGTSTEVFQLEGGIQRYMDAFPDGGFFEGTMHVFDRRGCVAPSACADGGEIDDASGADGVAAGARKVKTLGRCVLCRQPWDLYQAKWRCSTCDIPVLACPQCQGVGMARSAVLCELCGRATSAPPPLPASDSTSSARGGRGGKKAADASGDRRARAAAEELEHLASRELDRAAARALLERLKDLSGSRKVRAVLHRREGQDLVLQLRALFDKALPSDAGVAGQCVEVLDLWLHDRPEQERLHRRAQPSGMALQLLRLPDATEAAAAAALRCAQRLAELPEARQALRSEIGAWASLVRSRLEAACSAAVQIEACAVARALTEHLKLSLGSAEGGIVWAAVAGAAGREDEELVAAALAAMWALRQGAEEEEAACAVRTAAAALRAHGAPAVQRWGCALLLQVAERGGAGAELLKEAGATELAAQAARSAPAAKTATRLMTALLGRAG